MRRNKRILWILAAAGLIFACVPISQPASVPIPTFDPNSIGTLIVLTADAAATQTALLLPPSPTVTAIPPTETQTESPTPTFLFLLPTLTAAPTKATPGSSNEQFDCQVISQDPADNTAMEGNKPFITTWEVNNIGSGTWSSTDTDYHFSSGARLHEAAVYDLPDSVPPASTIKLKVNMKAPNEAGTYKTIWRIRIGKIEFCPMNLTIVVN